MSDNCKKCGAPYGNGSDGHIIFLHDERDEKRVMYMGMILTLEQKLRVARESLAKIVRWNPRTTTATLAEQTLEETK